MALKNFNPTTPGRRNLVLVDRSDLWKGDDPTNDDVAPIVDFVSEVENSLMLVGHLPFLDRVVAQLVAGDADRNVVQFAAGGLVALLCEDGQWVIATVVAPGPVPTS